MIENLIKLHADKMIAELNEIREQFTHSGDKGDMAEDIFRAFVRKHLPRKCDIGHGEVIDIHGHRTGQCDVVIVNEDHPCMFNRDKPSLFFVEGVSAIGEVKMVLDSKELNNSLKNSLKHKKLETKYGAGALFYMNKSDEKRFYKSPPSFLFAFESKLSMDTIFKKLIEFKNDNNCKDTQLLDAIFILNRGSLFDVDDGQGVFQLINSSGESIVGWSWNKGNVDGSQNILFDLLAWLSIVMPKVTQLFPILTHYLMKNRITSNVS